ncbi:hypothetical protein [Gimesia aquarii]|uniref:Outer membrane lipoprotein-sorting protein n=1 Tax=Gimesia aquarii TaxID=2527964 RepID=A0A517WNP6_9PLAN|nr:hypothetical protein [Gimesia aquarii]QDU06890.1 hypothetical protein V202x_02340 [Gimesia aquarii]
MLGRLSLTLMSLTFLLNSPAIMRAAPPTDDNERKLNPKEIQKAFAFLAKQLSSNLDSIQTWQGTYRFFDKVHFKIPKRNEGSGYWEITQGQLPFWLDQKQDKLRVNYELSVKPDNLQLIPQEHVKANSWLNSQWIVRREESFALSENHFGRRKEFHQNISGRILYRLLKYDLHSNGRFFDPRGLFGSGSDFSDSFANNCDMYATALSGKKGDEQKQKALMMVSIIEKTNTSGDKFFIVTKKFKPMSPKATPNIYKVTYDSRYGFNTTKYEQYSGLKLRHKRIFRYKKVDGIYLPEKVSIEHFQNKEGQEEELIRSRTVTLIESKLNLPIELNLFEVKSLDLQYGERMWDSIKNQAFIQDRQGLVPVKDFVFKAK